MLRSMGLPLIQLSRSLLLPLLTVLPKALRWLLWLSTLPATLSPPPPPVVFSWLAFS